MKSTVCPRHGSQGIGLVCQHIAFEIDTAERVGFHWADNTDLARPDAWRSACETRLGNDPDDPAWFDDAGFKILCSACWDEAKRICGGFATP